MVMQKKSHTASHNPEAKFSEGEKVDVAEYLRDHGNPDAAEEWEKYDGRIEEIAPKKAFTISEKRLVKALARVAIKHPKYRSKVASILGLKKKAAWTSLPKGWTEQSVKKFWDSLSGDAKHKVTACMRKMDGKVDDPGAFCASLRDHVEGKSWRSEER